MALPPEFVKSLVTILPGNEITALTDAIENTRPVTSVRFNPYKIHERPTGRQVPWNRYGFLLDERPSFTLDPAYHAGVYYVQEASSMFVEHIYRSAVGEKEGIRLLDLCAAPGGKSTLYSTVVGLGGLVVANEVIRPRAMTLADNIQRWGLGNVVVTNNDPSHFAGFRNWFDVVAVDAPCSGEGMFRKDPKAIEEWSPESAAMCAARQRLILSDIWDTLKPGGILIYSTCTYNTQENENNISWLCRQYECESIDMEVPSEWGIVIGTVANGSSGDIKTFRFYPHMLEGEGFFAAVVRKGGNSERSLAPKPRRTIFTNIPKNAGKEVARLVKQPEYMRFAEVAGNVYAYYETTFPDVKTVAESMSTVTSGIMMGQLFSGKLKPAHPLALFHDINTEAIPQASLTLDCALDYLRKQNIDASSFSDGMNLVLFGNFPLGWAKRIGNRVNNLYPKELRIMNL